MNRELSNADRQTIHRAYERVSAQGWGLAVGVLAALGLFLATAVLVMKGGPPLGPHLGLLSNYLPGYNVSWRGALVGAGYAFVLFYIAGRVTGTMYNWIVDRS